MATSGDIEGMINARLRRQDVALYDPRKRVQVVLGEAALRTLVCTPETLEEEQLRKLLTVAALPSVEIRVIGFHQRMPIFPSTAFSVRDEMIVLDHLTGEQTIVDRDEAASWLRFFTLLREAASTGEQARELIQRAMDNLR